MEQAAIRRVGSAPVDCAASPGGVSDLEAVALAKAVHSWAKAHESDLAVGEHEISAQFLVNVEGTLTRKPDTSKKATSSIPWKLAMAVLMEKSGITGPSARKLVAEALEAAMAAGEDKKAALKELLLSVEDAEASVEKLINALPRVPVKGALLTDLEVSVERVVSISSGSAQSIGDQAASKSA